MVAEDVPLSIRLAGPADAPALAALLRDFMHHEGKTAGAPVNGETVATWIDGPRAACEILIAELAGRAVGYLAFYRAFSLFRGGPLLVVENLFVADSARRRGVGRRLLAATAAEANRRGQGRIELHVRSENSESRAFYEATGFFAPGESVYRIEDEALGRLAREAE